MNVGEAPPDIDRLFNVTNEEPDGERDGRAEFNSCESHEAEVSVEGEIIVGSEQFAELSAALQESTESTDYGKLSMNLVFEK